MILHLMKHLGTKNLYQVADIWNCTLVNTCQEIYGGSTHALALQSESACVPLAHTRSALLREGRAVNRAGGEIFPLFGTR